MATNLSLRLKNMLTNHQGWHLNTCSRKYALQNDHSWADQIAIVTESAVRGIPGGELAGPLARFSVGPRQDPRFMSEDFTHTA
jgi:hypothetical protein